MHVCRITRCSLRRKQSPDLTPGCEVDDFGHERPDLSSLLQWQPLCPFIGATVLGKTSLGNEAKAIGAIRHGAVRARRRRPKKRLFFCRYVVARRNIWHTDTLYVNLFSLSWFSEPVIYTQRTELEIYTINRTPGKQVECSLEQVMISNISNPLFDLCFGINYWEVNCSMIYNYNL